MHIYFFYIVNYCIMFHLIYFVSHTYKHGLFLRRELRGENTKIEKCEKREIEKSKVENAENAEIVKSKKREFEKYKNTKWKNEKMQSRNIKKIYGAFKNQKTVVIIL